MTNNKNHSQLLLMQLTDSLAKNIRLTRALQKFLRWFDQYERSVDDEVRETNLFLDARDAADKAREALRS